MGSYKKLMNSLSDDASLRTLSKEETEQLRRIYLNAFADLQKCCGKHGITVMLIGGSALGAVRHQGFIPWDDDLDAAITRADFEKLKKIFDPELGDKYLLASPNYRKNARNRFPQMLINHTLLVEAGEDLNDTLNKIKIDLFIIENVPENKLHRTVKGLKCSALMMMGSYADSYQNRNEAYRNYLCKTEAGKKEYRKRMLLGFLFSYRSFQSWMDRIDKACQYGKRTSLMSIPTGRGHYFGEIRPAGTFVPVKEGIFEGMQVNLPGNPEDYLSNLYGENYMSLPPEEKRERHFILDIRFSEEKDG